MKQSKPAMKPVMKVGTPSATSTPMYVHGSGHSMGSMRQPKGAEMMRSLGKTK